jgi:hypothetical protein
MVLGLLATPLGSGAAGKQEHGSATTATQPTSGSGSTPPTAAAATQPSKAATGAAVATEATEPPTTKACPQCGSTEPWGISSWCPKCFYHPRLGLALAPPPPPDPEVRHLQEGHVEQAESYAAVLKSIPSWVHVLVLGIFGVLGLSVYQTLKLPRVGYERALWTLAQASLGFLAAALAHFLAFLKAVPSTDKYGPFDIVFKPFEFWGYTIRNLPSGAWRLWMFAWGLTAAFAAIVFIGGIRYSSVFETKSKGKKSTWYQTSQIAPQERQAIRLTNG